MPAHQAGDRLTWIVAYESAGAAASYAANSQNTAVNDVWDIRTMDVNGYGIAIQAGSYIKIE